MSLFLLLDFLIRSRINVVGSNVVCSYLAQRKSLQRLHLCSPHNASTVVENRSESCRGLVGLASVAALVLLRCRPLVGNGSFARRPSTLTDEYCTGVFTFL